MGCIMKIVGFVIGFLVALVYVVGIWVIRAGFAIAIGWVLTQIAFWVFPSIEIARQTVWIALSLGSFVSIMIKASRE
jgi:hypothetical protein